MVAGKVSLPLSRLQLLKARVPMVVRFAGSSGLSSRTQPLKALSPMDVTPPRLMFCNRNHPLKALLPRVRVESPSVTETRRSQSAKAPLPMLSTFKHMDINLSQS